MTMQPKPYFDFAALQARLVPYVESIARHLLPNGKRVGHNWTVGGTDGRKGKSMSVCLLGGPCPGIWKDYATEEKGDIAELWAMVRNVSNYEAAMGLSKQYLNENGPQLVVNPSGREPFRKEVIISTDDKEHEKKPMNLGTLRTLQLRLEKNADAMAYLKGEKRGLDDNTIAHFGLGLSLPYKEKETGIVRSDSLMSPMRSPTTGLLLGKNAYTPIPGVSKGSIADNSIMKGYPRTYWADQLKDQLYLFICEGLKDTWRVWQELSKAGKIGDWMVISASHGTNIPNEWKEENFWRRWHGRIYLGQDNDTAGNGIITKLLPYIGGEARRVLVPVDFGKDWTDFFQRGGTIEKFFGLVQEAGLAGVALATDDEPGDKEGSKIASSSRMSPKPGIYSYKPVDINGAYSNSYLYYTIQRHIVALDETTGVTSEGLETVIVRSDRQLLSTYTPPPVPGKKVAPVLKLTDGTLIEKEPKPSPNASWEWDSIDDYVKGRSKARPLLAIVKEIVGLLKQTVWLPNDEDYYALALIVPVTYTQAIFDAVPSILANGPMGSGKTQLGNAMAKFCANGSVVGQVSAAAAARHIDETRGFVVIDDIEAIAAKTGKNDPTFSEFIQLLKLGYNKVSAVKVWTDVKAGMKNEKLNFFGVKFLSNTQGSDSILGSRLIRIQTLVIPEGTPANFRDFSVDEQDHLRGLRNELHTWGFMNTDKVNDTYHRVHAGRSDRETEIAAPLRTMAQICGDPEITANLEACLARQQVQQESFNEDPVKALKIAVRNLIKQGFDTVTLTHVGLELTLLLEANYGKSSTTEIPEWERPSWISNQLRSNGLIEVEDVGRVRVFGKHLRLFRFTSRVLLKERTDNSGNQLNVINRKEPEAFCRGCPGCPYRDVGCEYMPVRMAKSNKELRVN